MIKEINPWKLGIGCSKILNIVRLSVFGDALPQDNISTHPKKPFDSAQGDRGWIGGMKEKMKSKTLDIGHSIVAFPRFSQAVRMRRY